ncbi:MAG TPA: hypothetical protein VFX50_13180 [Gemmatimonadales bacterium]|nr:hypothetical protein [Gemmatimonadales bacterium]
MLNDLTLLGLSAALLCGLPTPTEDAHFALSASGAVRLVATGKASYGALPATAELPQAFSITLGAESKTGALVLMQRAGAAPLAGRYAVREYAAGNVSDFSALFVAGSPSEPMGVFRGEQGSITITATRPGRVEGRFRIEARGFLAAAPERDDLRVTLEGTFVAYADRTVATITRLGGPMPM